MGSTVRVWLAVFGLLVANAGPWPILAQQQQQQQQSHDDNQLEATAGADRLPNCLIRCSLAGNTRPNIDRLAHDMTNQIVAEIGSGQLTQQQLREPLWFEHRVTAQLNRQQQLERENVQKYYTLLGGAEESQRLREQQEFDLQQQLQRNLFQQPRFGQFIAQSQQQQQQQHGSSSQFQQQHTHNTFYAQPHYVIPAGQPQQTREERRQQTSVYTRQEQQPQPIVTIQPQQTREERRQQTSMYTRQEQQPQPQPIVTIQPQQTREERRQQTSVYTRQEQQPQPQPIVTIQPQQTRQERRQQTSVYTRQEHRPQPVVHIRPAPTVTTVNESTRTEERRTNQQNAAPTTVIQLPAQETRRQRIQHHHIESQRAASPALIYVESRPQTSTTTVVRNVTTVEERQTRLPQTHVYRPADDDKYYVHHRQRYEQRRVQPAANPVVVHIPAPVRTEQRHSIYRHLTQNAETQVPDYQPQWRVEHTAETLRRLEQQQQQHAWRQPQQPAVVVVAPTTTTSTDNEIIEHTQRIARLRNDLQYYAIRPFNEQQLNSSVRTGHFWDGTQLYVFNSTSGHYLPAATGNQQRETTASNTVFTTVNDRRTLVPLPGVRRNEQLSRQEYTQRTHQLVAALRTHGYTSAISDQMIEEIVRRGGYAHNGVRFVWLGGNYVEETDVQVQTVDEEQHRQVAATEATHTTLVVEETIETADETHERKLHELYAQLRAIGAADFGEFERNQTLRTGVFIRDATVYTYDNGTRTYVGERLTERDVQRIYERLQQLLRHYGYRETTHRETANMLQDGGFCRGGWRWVYEWRSGALTQTERTASQTEELSEAEYRAIYERIQETLRRLGYGAMSERQCNVTVVSGTFDRGGIVYRLDVERDTFVHDELEREAYEARVQVLRELQRAIGLRALSDAEVHSIIYRGHFVQQGHRYEYNPATRHYEQLDVSAAEYEELLQRLRQQLVDIGYEHMSLVECNQTIYTGEFGFNGYDWVYRYDTQEYARSDEQRPTVAPAPFPAETVYSLVTEAAPAAPSTEEWLVSTTHRPIISSNRGDQPPQVFVDDYSVEAVEVTEPAVPEPEPEPLPLPVETGTQVEQEPGVGYYPVTAVTEASIVEEYAAPTVATVRLAPVQRAPEEVRQDQREEVEQEEPEEEEEEGGDEGDDNGDEYDDGEEGGDEE